jgi:hypothetical protein
VAVGLGARKSNMDTKFTLSAQAGPDNYVSGGQVAGRILVPFGGGGGGGGGDTVHLWVWGITAAAIIYLLGIHWTLGGIRSLAD